jgi:hypothetical protein
VFIITPKKFNLFFRFPIRKKLNILNTESSLKNLIHCQEHKGIGTISRLSMLLAVQSIMANKLKLDFVNQQHELLFNAIKMQILRSF